jgi:hypothetical protein
MAKKITQFQKDFSKGYMCACANIINTHGESGIAEDVFKGNGMSVKQMRSYGIDEADIQTLMPVIKEVRRKNKLYKSKHSV